MSKPGEQLIEPVHQCCPPSLTKLSSGRGKERKKAIRDVDILMGVLAGVPNLALQTNLKIGVLWRKLRNNCKGYPCEDEVSVFVGGGWQRNRIALSLYISAALTAGSDINMTDLTAETSLPLYPLHHNRPQPQFPTRSASVVSRHQDQHTHCPSIQSPSPMHWASSSFPPVFSHPTPNIPISLALNGPCVPLTLRRVWGWSQPPVLVNGFFLNVHTLWPAALYSNCVNKMANGEGHRRHTDIP